MLKSLVRILVTLFMVIVIILIIIRNESNFQRIVDEITPEDYLASTLLLYFIFVISGWRFYIFISRLYHKSFDLYDVLTMPLVMNFCGYILPFKGGLFYSIIYLAKKYNIKYSEGSALNLLSYIIPFSIFGVIGILVSMFVKFSWSFFLFSIILAFNFQFVFWVNKFISKHSRKFKSNKYLNFFNNIFSESEKGLKTKKLVYSITLISLLKVLLEISWFIHANVVLDLGFNIVILISYAVLKNISMLFRIIPGNVGINEILGGLISEYYGIAFNQGFLLMLFLRVISLLLSLIGGGIIFLNNNYKYKLL